MAARKSSPRKIRLLKKTRQTSPVPAWIILRTKRTVRSNPKRRAWRSTDVEVGQLSQELERVYTINLGKALLSVDTHRAPRAINMIKEFARHHMKTEEIKIEEDLAHQIWSKGVRSPPRKIRVRMSKTDEGYVLVSPYTDEKESKETSDKEVKKGKSSKDSKKDTPVKDVTTDAPAKEVKETPIKEVKKETPAKEVKKETPIKEVKKETPIKEVKKAAPAKVKKETPAKEVKKKSKQKILFLLKN